MTTPLDLVAALWRRRFLRFLAVGALNTAFGYGVFALCVLAGLHYTVAALVANVLGILFNFRTYGALVFASHDRSLLARFFGAYAVNYVAGIAAIALLKRVGVPVLVTSAITLLPLAALSYWLNRRWVFDRAPAGEPEAAP
jgi:putative flippase GtrA